MLFIGDDWAEAHHDIEIEDEAGRLLVRKRLPEGLAGVTLLHELIAEHLDPSGEPDQVLVGIETDRGPWVQALLATGYLVYAINPLQVARYRERHSTSGAKSDPGDAHLLAEIVRLDRAHHRRIAGDSEIAEHVKVAARAHQTMIWSRVRQVNTLRSLLREYYPAALAVFGTDLASPDALAVLAAAPTPELGRRLSQARIETLLRKAGRQRNIAATAARIKTALGSDQLTARPGVVPAYAASASALVAVLTTMVTQIEVLAGQVEQGFGRHPDVEIYRSQPGLGVILGAGCWPSSATTRTVTPTPSLGRTTPACHRSRERPAPNGSCWPATPATGASATRCSGRPTVRFEPHPAPAPATTVSGPVGPATTKPFAPSRTGSSASSTAVSATTPSTTRTRPGTPPTTSSPSPPDCQPEDRQH
jgi:transposase